MRKTALLLLPVLFLITFALHAEQTIDPDLERALQQTTEPVEVVVTFHGQHAPTEAQVALLEDAGISQGFTFRSLPIAGILATAQQVETLAESPEVRSLYFNKQLEYYNDDATALTGVDRARKDRFLTAQNGGFPISGKDVGLVVHDSGVDGTHPDLEFGEHLVQNVLGTTNPNAYSSLLPIVFVENQPNTDTNSGHGTHVAGSAGGTGEASSGKYEGVAPGADLVGYGSGAVLFILDAIGGFDYAVTNQFRYGIRIITNSWGTTGAFDPDNPVNVASKRAYDRNIVVLFAAGNEGPGANTLNPYSVAPWVIGVGAGNDAGRLADFSSRGSRDGGDTFTVDGETWTWKDQPAIVAPGVDIVSTRTLSPVGVLSTDQDAETIDEAHLAFYTTLSGTSMATPHAAGIVALMLEADPTLAPLEVKSILQQTATNMTGREAFEVGAGYVNAFAALHATFDRAAAYGPTVNKDRTFNSNVNFSEQRENFTVQYDPVELTSNSHPFTVPDNTDVLEARISAEGLLGETGNTLNLVLIDPNGNEFSSGIFVLFPIFMDRVVRISSPPPAEWTLEIRGLRGATDNPTDGVALPEDVDGTITILQSQGFSGLDDIEGHAAKEAILVAVANRMVDGFPNGKYKPDKNIKRIKVGDYLMMGQRTRQHLPVDGSKTFGDVSGDLENLIAESVTARGAALRDTFQVDRGVMLASSGTFEPDGTVNRVDLAYSLVQSLGLEDQALALNDDPVTVMFKGERIPIEDQDEIPQEFRGYVQLALDLTILNARFSLSQGEFDLEPTVTAEFDPAENSTRAAYAVAVTRTQEADTEALAQSQSTSAGGNLAQATQEEQAHTLELHQNYPNPFNPSTSIDYSVPDKVHVELTVYNILGQKVATLVNSVQDAGDYQVNFNASRLASGVYLYKLTVGNRIITRKMNLIK